MPSVAEKPTLTPDWRHDAACPDEDPELFFPVLEGNSKVARKAYEDDVAEAKAVCRGCDVLQQCRAWALETRQPAGIFGGLTEDERAEILTTATRDVA